MLKVGVGTGLGWVKARNVLAQTVLKTFFSLYTSNDASNIWKKCSSCSKMSLLSKNYQYAKLKAF